MLADPDSIHTEAPRQDAGDRPRLVVVGAGLAGLSAALDLHDRGARIDILEASEEPGGNAWYETWRDIRQPTAGSCFRAPLPGGHVERLLERFDLATDWRSTGSAMQVLFRTGALLGNLHEVSAALLRHPSWLLKPKVWGLTGGLLAAALTGRPLVPAAKALGEPIFTELYRFLDRLGPGKGRFPAVPWTPDCGIARAEMEALDRMTIGQFLFEPSTARQLSEDLQPPRRLGRLVRLAVTTTLEVEGLLLDNCSAYVGLHFLVGYLHGDLVALPGGNGAVSKALADHLQSQPNVTLSTEARVTGIRATDRGYRVAFQSGNRTRTINCDGVIVATPKEAALSFLPDLPTAQREAMAEIEYSDYAIANARLKRPVWTDNFGGYFIGDKPGKLAKTGFCRAGGVVNAGWRALPGTKEAGGLSFLKPVPQRADQGKLTRTDETTLRAEAEVEIRRTLAAIGADPSVLEDVRLHLWPHGLVSPRPGQVADDLFVRASAPFGAIAFANQDSIGVGCLEAAIESGQRAASQLAQAIPMAASNLTRQTG
ncbi:NAD(P)/FAD-dependent oxidoreductase [Notoacmeibacter sp. MSK16QG-6]|uniref:protoporphyrinogen/coproporphyrinogen oxidase n=1 Tax=Notoacmeibacter sp. MSK16QG-6 TaxID=2957982 RepID=UPI00209E783C|nr:FAD-dependent oxidoreductase [Notoacmeibacter sp. MSK16QG-6]MCP1200486.1 FAD-dependent oxidoreductase [Notoacmeibacter sp. MSK16QG-6]